ncbi:MAG: hypothetical protein KGV57_03455 [Fusobacterium sp.]|nr:hypothetical protein [Fusobacterium sp.]
MKKKILVLLSFLIFSLLSFSQINDTSNLFTETQKEEINKKTEEIKKEKEMLIFINTFNEDEGFVINNPERALIINLKKIAEEKYKVEVSFSKDIDVEEKREDIDKLLNESGEILEDKEYSDYVLAILDGVYETLEEVNMAPLEEMSLSEAQNEKENNKNYYYILVAIILFLGLGALGFVYKNKQKRRKK